MRANLAWTSVRECRLNVGVVERGAQDRQQCSASARSFCASMICSVRRSFWQAALGYVRRDDGMALA
jgi:hypothetical protein